MTDAKKIDEVISELYGEKYQLFNKCNKLLKAISSETYISNWSDVEQKMIKEQYDLTYKLYLKIKERLDHLESETIYEREN